MDASLQAAQQLPHRADHIFGSDTQERPAFRSFQSARRPQLPGHPSDTDPAELTLSIISANWDRSGFTMDVNVVFPMD